MSNLDKAVEVILPHTGACEQCARVGHVCLDCEREAREAAECLAHAGLLAPDLPTLSSDYASIEVSVRSTIINMHDAPERYDDDSILVGTWNGEVEFSLGKFDEVSVYMSTDQARQFAHALLGVTDYTEGNQ